MSLHEHSVALPEDVRSAFTPPESLDMSTPIQQLPDPFQLDDPNDPISDEEEDNLENKIPFGASSQITIVPAETDVPLQSEQAPKLPSQEATPFTASPYKHDNKPEPPLPSEGDELTDTLQLYIPGLVVPGLFQPIHAVDPLSTLLTKYIPDPSHRPPRDTTGIWKGKDYDTLVMTNSWRALAQMACDRIINSPPTELDTIFELWYLRLSCLARLRLFNQTTSECNNLFAVLNSVEPLSARLHLFDNVLPFELEVMYARLKYWAGDHLGYLDALLPLLTRCKKQAKEAKDKSSIVMWKERGTRMTLTIASQLIEMKDTIAAARLLEPLCQDGKGSPELLSAIARVYLQGGHLAAASRYFSLVQADPNVDEVTRDMNRALEAMAYGKWDIAIEILRRILESQPNNPLAANNWAVALLNTGRVIEGIEAMEKALRAFPLAVTATEPWLFNLATLYELRSTITWDRKRELLVNTAKWSGDGLKASCLKLPNS